MSAFEHSRAYARVEEFSAGEEILSNSSSEDVTEVEEHVHVFSRHEPLPWSQRDPIYDRPLPSPKSMLGASPQPMTAQSWSMASPADPKPAPRPKLQVDDMVENVWESSATPTRKDSGWTRNRDPFLFQRADSTTRGQARSDLREGVLTEERATEALGSPVAAPSKQSAVAAPSPQAGPQSGIEGWQMDLDIAPSPYIAATLQTGLKPADVSPQQKFASPSPSFELIEERALVASPEVPLSAEPSSTMAQPEMESGFKLPSQFQASESPSKPELSATRMIFGAPAPQPTVATPIEEGTSRQGNAPSALLSSPIDATSHAREPSAPWITVSAMGFARDEDKPSPKAQFDATASPPPASEANRFDALVTDAGRVTPEESTNVDAFNIDTSNTDTSNADAHQLLVKKSSVPEVRDGSPRMDEIRSLWERAREREAAAATTLPSTISQISPVIGNKDATKTEQVGERVAELENVEKEAEPFRVKYDLAMRQVYDAPRQQEEQPMAEESALQARRASFSDGRALAEHAPEPFGLPDEKVEEGTSEGIAGPWDEATTNAKATFEDAKTTFEDGKTTFEDARLPDVYIPSATDLDEELQIERGAQTQPSTGPVSLEEGTSPAVVPSFEDTSAIHEHTAESTNVVDEEVQVESAAFVIVPIPSNTSQQAYLLVTPSTGHRDEAKRLKRLGAKYRYDWRVVRKDYVETHFFPRLFNPGRLIYLHVPRKPHPVPRVFNVLVEDQVDPGARYRRDWRVSRRYQVDSFFNPQLFDAGHLRRASIPLRDRERRRMRRLHMAQVGCTDPHSAGARLRHDWQAHRAHPVDYYFEAEIFDRYEPADLRIRQRWYSIRPRPVDYYQNPNLLELAYVQRRQKNDQSMIRRLTSHIPSKLPVHSYRWVSPFDRYRQDWQVTREYYVETFFDPGLFDEERAREDQTYWEGVIGAHRAAYSRGDDHDQIEPKHKSNYNTLPLINWRPFEEGRLSPVGAPLPPTKQRRTQTNSKAGSETGVEAGLETESKSRHPNSVAYAKQDLVFSENSLGPVNDDGQEYDWQFWKDSLAEGHFVPEAVYGHLTLSDNYSGIPIEVRPALWVSISGADRDHRLLLEYEVLKDQMSPHQEQLEEYSAALLKEDVLTVPETRNLMHVLTAYSLYDTECSISPSLVALAAPLVKELPPDEAFSLLCRLMFQYNQRSHHLPSSHQTDLRIFQLEALLAQIDPELAAHATAKGVEFDLAVSDWYRGLFPALPGELRSEMVNLYLFDQDHAVTKMALCLLTENRDRILGAPDFASIMSILEDSPRMLLVNPEWSSSEWIAQAAKLPVDIDTLSELEDAYYQAVLFRREEEDSTSNLLLTSRYDSIYFELLDLAEQVKSLCEEHNELAINQANVRLNFALSRQKNALQARRIYQLECELDGQHAHYQAELNRCTCALKTHKNGMQM